MECKLIRHQHTPRRIDKSSESHLLHNVRVHDIPISVYNRFRACLKNLTFKFKLNINVISKPL